MTDLVFVCLFFGGRGKLFLNEVSVQTVILQYSQQPSYSLLQKKKMKGNDLFTQSLETHRDQTKLLLWIFEFAFLP